MKSIPLTVLLPKPFLPITEEELCDVLRSDFGKVGTQDHAFPKCPQGGKCECPNAKNALGLLLHECSPDIHSGCIVRHRLCPDGEYVA